MSEKKGRIWFMIKIILLVMWCISLAFALDMDKKSMESKEYDNNNFYYIMSQGEFNRFKNNVDSLSKGDSYEKIIKLLGKPYSDNHVRGKRFDSPLISRDLFYYIKQYEKDIVNEHHDSYVVIVLDRNDKLVRISSNCSDINELK